MWPARNKLRRYQRYFVFAAAFFLRSAHRFFIISESFLRPAGLSLFAGFALAALFLGALLACLVCEIEFDALRILRAAVSLAISFSISCTILAVSTQWSPSRSYLLC
jgi:hypothetical protein